MACVKGRIAKVEISTDGGTTYNNLPLVVDATINLNTDELDCTTHDDTVRVYEPNLTDSTMDVTYRFSEGDAVQEALRTAAMAATKFKMYFWFSAGAGNLRYEADAFFTSFSESTPLDGLVETSGSWRLSGLAEGTTV